MKMGEMEETLIRELNIPRMRSRLLVKRFIEQFPTKASRHAINSFMPYYNKDGVLEIEYTIFGQGDEVFKVAVNGDLLYRRYDDNKKKKLENLKTKKK